MLFHSLEFIFLFLPVTLAGFYWSRSSLGQSATIFWLILASGCFYAWWDPLYLALLFVSLLMNYGLGTLVGKPSVSRNLRKWILRGGIVFNLGVLGYFKYANFLFDNINALFASGFHLEKIILPLGISFFTFQKIAFLVDMYHDEREQYPFADYVLFVLFFPQLIAGPIVHHKEIIPQIASETRKQEFQWENLVVGIAIFSIGAFKKVQLADRLIPFSSPAFTAATQGKHLSLIEAWVDVSAYTLQIYFDFSGYSDMAIGLGKMFGIRLPVNFNSPYKAENIIDFWRRWHITLSRFLRDYLYIPLGGNRHGKFRRYQNLIITMALGGLWHGASWNFLIWGLLHGSYLAVNHGWRTLTERLPTVNGPAKTVLRLSACALTLAAVMVGWVFFRAETFHGALSVLKSMSSPHAWAAPHALETNLPRAFRHIVCFAAIVFLMPNTQEWMASFNPALQDSSQPRNWSLKIPAWKPTWVTAVSLGILMAMALLYRVVGSTSEFLYFQF